MPYALNQGVKIHYEVRGEGLPIVLQPGGLGDLTIWEGAGYLSGLSDYKCILIDPRGHGQSDCPEDLESHAMSNYVSDVLAVLDNQGIYRASFFGWSNGGRVGFALAASQPGRINALISLGSCVDFELEPTLAEVSYIRDRGIAAYIAAAEIHEGSRFPLWMQENFLKDDPEMLALEIEAWTKWGGAKKIAANIKVPTLLITGGNEDPKSDCQKIASSITTGAQLVVLKNLGHIQAFLRADLILPHVRDFLSRVQFGSDRRFS